MSQEYTREMVRITIRMLRNNINEYMMPEYKMFIVDNDTEEVCKDSIKIFEECEIYYTNNKQRFKNKQSIDLQLHDMLDCINMYDMKDEDFIVKIDYNCISHPSSSFIKKLNELSEDYNKFDCIICYGIINNTITSKIGRCINKVYGIRCRYLKTLNDGNLNVYSDYIIHRDWASVSFDIPDEKTVCMKTLGFYIHTPSSNSEYVSI